MLVGGSATPEPPALLPGEEEQLQLQHHTVMASAPGAVTPAVHQLQPHRPGNVTLFTPDVASAVLHRINNACPYIHGAKTTNKTVFYEDGFSHDDERCK